MTENEQKKLGNILWDIANQLRGAMNADDFRDYMLSFLFLRYLSDNYEAAAQRELGLDYPDTHAIAAFTAQQQPAAAAEEEEEEEQEQPIITPLQLWYRQNSKDDIKTFEISPDFKVICKTQDTSYGFRHVALLQKNYHEVCAAKCCYYNRTWESFTYQSVGHAVINKYFKKQEAEIYREIFDKIGKHKAENFLHVPCLIATLGNVFGTTEKEKNDWKKRFIEKIPGIDFPEDFDQLPESVKTHRLDSVIKIGLNKEVDNNDR